MDLKLKRDLLEKEIAEKKEELKRLEIKLELLDELVEEMQEEEKQADPVEELQPVEIEYQEV